MYSKYKYLIRNMGILTLSNFSSKILVFLLVPLYTSVLSTTEYGTYDLVLSTIQLIFPIITANIIDAVMRYCMEDQYEKKEIVSIGIRYVLFGILIVAIFLFFTAKLHLVTNIVSLEIYIFFYYAFYTLYQFFIQFAKGMEKVKELGIAGVLSTFVMISANFFFLLILKRGLKGFFCANIISQFLPALYLFFVLKTWNYINIFIVNNKLQKKMLLYSVPLIFSTLGWWVNNAASKYFVSFLVGVAANGILSVAYKIPSIINTIQNIFIQAWQISAIKEYGTEEEKYFYGDSFQYLNFFMCICCAILIMLSKPIAMLLYAKDFYIAWKYVPLLLLASVINSASGFLGPILSAEKNSKDMANSAIFGMLANLVLNASLVYLIGIQGATLATVFSSFVIYICRRKAVGSHMFIAKEIRIYIGWIVLGIQAIFEIESAKFYVELPSIILLLLLNGNGLIRIISNTKIK